MILGGLKGDSSAIDSVEGKRKRAYLITSEERGRRKGEINNKKRGRKIYIS